MDYAGNYACLPAAFYKCIGSNNLFAWSEIMETVCCAAACEGNDQLAALMDLINELLQFTCHLSSSQTSKNTSTEHSVLLLTFLMSVSKIWCYQD